MLHQIFRSIDAEMGASVSLPRSAVVCATDLYKYSIQMP